VTRLWVVRWCLVGMMVVVVGELVEILVVYVGEGWGLWGSVVDEGDWSSGSNREWV